ncbi:hypothetical protein WJX73_006174 [Symbiochloris irregularis]|uniref:Subtilisin n=1 Tax=Symbiochloris irregularis TaxID=706552 RepID=A0AAW1Q3X4_9CHLO
MSALSRRIKPSRPPRGLVWRLLSPYLYLAILVATGTGVAADEETAAAAVRVHLRTGILHIPHFSNRSWAHVRQRSLVEGASSSCNELQCSFEQLLVTLAPTAVEGSSRLSAVVQDAGGYICGYVPDHTYRVVLPPSQQHAVASLSDVISIQPYDASMKVAPDSTVAATHRVIASVPLPLVQAVVESAASQRLVHWVAPVPRILSSNYLATGLAQTSIAGQINSTTSYAINSPATHWFWNAGIQGQNMIVGMGDTGVDVFQCFFVDSRFSQAAFSSQLLVEPGTNIPYFDSTTHRKVRYYRAYIDNVDANGHGSHCAGSALGYPETGGPANWSDWSGSAPQAKIAFTDLGSGTSGSISVPSNLVAQYFPYPYARGARVHSDSWGTSSVVAYDSLAADFDEFSNQNQDFLPVVAAGNFGYEDIDSTVTSPAIAKNTISVGAGLTAAYALEVESEQVLTDADVLQMNSTGGLPGSSADGTVLYKVMQADYGVTFNSLTGTGASLPLIAAPRTNANGCSMYPKGTSLAGAAVLTLRGNCSFAVKTANAQMAGAAAVLITNNVNTGYFRMSQVSFNGPLTIPTGSLPLNSANFLYNALQRGSTLNVTFQNYTLPTTRYDSIAFFSSIGPTADGRYKPDMIAPGTTLSSKAAPVPGTPSCTLALDRGTSMATPIVAGSVALVRQYFVTGFYPSGTQNSANGFNPSGALKKAVLLGGAAQMEGIAPSNNAQYDGVPLDPTPSSRQGYGRINMAASLPLANNPSATGYDQYLNLQVVDWKPFVIRTQVDQYCVQAAGGPITITLVWADPPADVTAAQALVNDLDLTVHADSLSGYSLRGNGAPGGDHVNNVEQVNLPYTTSGLVVITVSATSLPMAPQNYSLVVQGAFTGQLASRYNPGWNGLVTSNCQLPVAAITSYPPVISNYSSVVMVFNSSTLPPNGFQCSLLGSQGQTSPSPLYNWRSCVSPVTLTGLADGRYLFQVRATGYITQDSRIFTLDRVAPKTTISNALVNQAGNQRSAAFQFQATDLVSVSYMCQLSSSGSQGIIQGVNMVGDWEPCLSPAIFSSLSSGNWSFRVMATDAAGNVERGPYASYNWTVSLTPGYPVMASNNSVVTSTMTYFSFGSSATSGRRLNAAVYFSCTLNVFDGQQFSSYLGPSTCFSPAIYSYLGTGLYQFSVAVASGLPGEGASSQGSAVAPAGFSPCVSPTSYKSLSDGNYVFLVQAVAASGASGPPARAAFVVDTTPPQATNVTFTSITPSGSGTPTSAVNGPSATIKQVYSLKPTFLVSWAITDGPLGSGVNRSYCYFGAQTDVTSQVQATVMTRVAGPLCSSTNQRQYLLTAPQSAFQIVAFDNANNIGPHHMLRDSAGMKS